MTLWTDHSLRPLASAAVIGAFFAIAFSVSDRSHETMVALATDYGAAEASTMSDAQGGEDPGADWSTRSGGLAKGGDEAARYFARPAAGQFNSLQANGGRWCEYRKEKVFDKYHNETFYVDEKVCLGS